MFDVMLSSIVLGFAITAVASIYGEGTVSLATRD